MSLKKTLNQIGLEEKEAAVYLAALELGSSSIQDLTRKSGINRTTVYQVLRSLKSQGLVSQTTSGKRKLILASNPINLKRNIKSKEQLLETVLPELLSLSSINPIKPRIVFYEGKDGHQEIYRETLKAKEIMAYWISPIPTLMETIGEKFLDWYIEERRKKNIWINIIHKKETGVESKYFDPKKYARDLKDVRFADEKTNLPNIMVVFDNKVAIMSTRKEGFGFIVESKDYAEMMKPFHNLLWNASSPHEKDYENTNPRQATEEDIYY